MKKRSCLVYLIFLVASIGACLWIIFRVENSSCDLSSLLIDEKEMPPGWRKTWIIMPEVLALDASEGSQQAYSIRMEYGDPPDQYGAYHTVYQYSNSLLSTLYFWLSNRARFYTGWSDLRETTTLSLHADQIQVKCQNSDDPYTGNGCAAVLRYGLYVSDFATSIKEGVMSEEEFKETLLKIDQRFSSCLK